MEDQSESMKFVSGVYRCHQDTVFIVALEISGGMPKIAGTWQKGRAS